MARPVRFDRNNDLRREIACRQIKSPSPPAVIERLLIDALIRGERLIPRIKSLAIRRRLFLEISPANKLEHAAARDLTSPFDPQSLSRICLACRGERRLLRVSQPQHRISE